MCSHTDMVTAARVKLKDAHGMKCTCNYTQILYENGCCCAKGEAIKLATEELEAAINKALTYLEDLDNG